MSGRSDGFVWNSCLSGQLVIACAFSPVSVRLWCSASDRCHSMGEQLESSSNFSEGIDCGKSNSDLLKVFIVCQALCEMHSFRIVTVDCKVVGTHGVSTLVFPFLSFTKSGPIDLSTCT